MADTRSASQRRMIMQAVKRQDTEPELVVRRLLHSWGFRYRLHRKDLPGSPDIVFSSLRKVIFVHGCFWHGHGCSKGRLPKSRLEYWAPKVESNLARDSRVVAALQSLGWEVLTVWQCEVRDIAAVERRLIAYLTSP
jgi:DNA mismatch endonuclease (patch repair protein)